MTLGSKCRTCGSGGSVNPVSSPTVQFVPGMTDGSAFSANVVVSPDEGNALKALANGLYVAFPTTGGPGTGGTTFDPVVAFATPISMVQVYGIDANGRIGRASLPATGAAETPNTVTSSTSIQLTATGDLNRALTASVKVSSDANNQLAVRSSGLYVPPPVGATPEAIALAFATPVTISQVFGVDAAGNPGRGVVSQGGAETANTNIPTPTVKVSTTGALGRTISADVKLSAQAGNLITVVSDGLLVSGTGGSGSVTSAAVQALYGAGQVSTVQGVSSAGASVKEDAAVLLQRLLTAAQFSFATVQSGTVVSGLQARVQFAGGTAVNLPGLVIPLEAVTDCNGSLLGYFVKP